MKDSLPASPCATWLVSAHRASPCLHLVLIGLSARCHGEARKLYSGECTARNDARHLAPEAFDLPGFVTK